MKHIIKALYAFCFAIMIAIVTRANTTLEALVLSGLLAIVALAVFNYLEERQKTELAEFKDEIDEKIKEVQQ